MGGALSDLSSGAAYGPGQVLLCSLACAPHIPREGAFACAVSASAEASRWHALCSTWRSNPSFCNIRIFEVITFSNVFGALLAHCGGFSSTPPPSVVAKKKKIDSPLLQSCLDVNRFLLSLPYFICRLTHLSSFLFTHGNRYRNSSAVSTLFYATDSLTQILLLPLHINTPTAQ